MSAIIADTRDAVVTAITNAMTAAALTPTIPTQAIYDIYFNLEQLTGGQVLVVPQKEDCEPLTRGGPRKREIYIDIAVQFKYGATGPTPAALDPYMKLAEDIADYFERRTLANGPVVRGVSHPHIFVDEQLRKFRTFTSVITLICLWMQ